MALDVRERDLAWLDSVWPITPNPRDCSTGWNARSRWQVLCRKVPGGTLAQTGEQQTLFIPWLAFESLVANPS